MNILWINILLFSLPFILAVGNQYSDKEFYEAYHQQQLAKQLIEERKARKIQYRNQLKLKFVQFEVVNDWIITKEEMKEALSFVEDEFVDNFFNTYDLDQSGFIKFDEYVRIHFQQDLADIVGEEDEIDYEQEEKKRQQFYDERRKQYKKIDFQKSQEFFSETPKVEKLKQNIIHDDF